MTSRHSGDSIEDERPFLWPRVTDGVRVLQCLARPGESLRSVGVQRDQRLTRLYPHTGLGVQYDTGTGLHRVLFAGPTRSQPPRGLADTARVQRL